MPSIAHVLLGLGHLFDYNEIIKYIFQIFYGVSLCANLKQFSWLHLLKENSFEFCK